MQSESSAHSEGSLVDEIKERGKEAAERASNQPALSWLARLGYASIGVLYLVIGILAVQVALGARSGQLTDPVGALAAISRQPLGEIMLLGISIGLVGYAVWGVLQAVVNPLREKKVGGNLLSRAGYFISALSHGALLVPAVRFLFSPYAFGSTEEQAEQVSASILSQPGGSWLVGAFGAGFLIFGAGQAVSAFKPDFGQRFDRYKLTPGQAIWIKRLGRFGSIGRAVVFILIGALILYAAVRLDPEAVGGMDAALLLLAQQPYGALFLGIVALGLVAFGLYQLIGAAVFRIRPR